MATNSAFPLEMEPFPLRLPAPLEGLRTLAYDLTWVWTPNSRALFESIAPDLWHASHHNPVRLLATVAPERLDELARDKAFTTKLAAQVAALRAGANAGAWYKDQAPALASDWRPFLAAYFCAEFGLTECFQIYSGGLGLLAGDHLRSAAQLGLPLVAVGLLYRNGYFHQAIDGNGMQHELFPSVDAARQPVRRVLHPATNQPLIVSVEMPGAAGAAPGSAAGREVRVQVWRCDVGPVRLYLLDTNLDENQPLDRDITANLYLGDHTRRIEQEIVLGIAGIRALAAMGEHPSVFHMNEGHAAFMALERIRQFRQADPALTFDQAREAAAPSHVFTTHTPVPAGIDRFSPSLVARYFAHYHDAIGLDLEGLLALGREDVANHAEAFSMAVLAIRTSGYANGVSKLHGVVSRKMWRNIWPGLPESDVPIGHVTNGVHTDFWVGPHMERLFDKALAPTWREKPHEPTTWSPLERVADADLWAARNSARADLVRACSRLVAAGKTAGTAARLDPGALTIGFSRRFAGYKRATLLLRDRQRLARLLAGETQPGKPPRPVQLLIAGKSHPGDGWGKHLIRDVVEFARSRHAGQGGGRVLFLEDYDIAVARTLVQGCDVWLNTPIRGLEASGTSGMKAALNGVLNASILDGWWDEAYAPDLGFEIPARGTYPSDAPDEDREAFEANELLLLFEQHIVPEFYDRDTAGVPTRWTSRMRRCIQALAPEFSTHRMVAQYAREYYFTAHQTASRRLAAKPDFAGARQIADQIARYRAHWPRIALHDLRVDSTADDCAFRVSVALETGGQGSLLPSELRVQALFGESDADALPNIAHAVDLKPIAPNAPRFEGVVRIPSDCSPRYAILCRVIPADERLVSPFIPGLVTNSTLARPRSNGHSAGPGAWNSTTAQLAGPHTGRPA